MRRVRSSNIKAVGHDGRSLHVHFANGAKYSYVDVPYAEFRRLKDASSVGAHFAAHIRDRYLARKLG
jgi:hypothetical protein